tara:strand:- start:1253 stop:1609 length:357 start_codon:yes stop_codon:yes gene_type:complete
MEYIKNIKHIKQKENEFNSFSFLDDMNEYIDVYSYYILLDNLSIRDINNIYKLSYIYWCKMIKNNMISIKNIFIKPNDIYNKSMINDLFNKFIHNTTDTINYKCKCIYLMNVIESNLI